MPAVKSFSDSYRRWNEDSLKIEVGQFIYVNDELGEEVRNLFASVIVVDSVKNSYAREQGTKIYLCRQARSSFREFWNERLREVAIASGLD